jgi:hypothetical protein
MPKIHASYFQSIFREKNITAARMANMPINNVVFSALNSLVSTVVFILTPYGCALYITSHVPIVMS